MTLQQLVVWLVGLVLVQAVLLVIVLVALDETRAENRKLRALIHPSTRTRRVLR